MHASPFAAPPSDGDGLVLRDVRVCIHDADAASPARLEALRSRLPADARIALLGACAAMVDRDDVVRVHDVDAGSDDRALLEAAARRFPGEHLVLVHADAELPEFGCERLLRALDRADVVGVRALDAAWRRPLPRDPGVEASVARVDALCFAHSERAFFDDPHLSLPSPLSAWHGDRLARLGAANAVDRDALDAAGLRVVVLDHLFAGGGPTPRDARAREHDPSDPEPPSPLAPLRQRIAAALATTAAPAQPGLDAKPVILHVLHGWGGGAERWVRDFAAADAHAHHLVLVARGSFARSRHGEWLELHDGAMSGPPLRRWPLPRPIADTALADRTYRDLLADVLRTFSVDAVIVSSLIGHSLDALRTGLPTTCIVHDHYPLWPTLHRDFGDATLRFDEAQRAADLAAQGDDAEFANRDAAHWRRVRDGFVAAALAARAALVAPSRSALANELRLAPEL
ncbi:MAG TPA: hypothetical protein VFS55_03655, partial [Dokdonella sp.]|nr:hypothetical protein [Dokdonella sp.]